MLDKIKITFYFPWLSSFSALILIAYLRIAGDQTLKDYYQLEGIFFNADSMTLFIALFGLILLLDTAYFQRRKRQNLKQYNKLQSQLETVWQSKKIQQEKAITSAGHTDKLKAFISDKLLETIEYDEKYLHFKGIAAEVRHNGVISYDKVMTALTKAIDQQRFLSLYEQNNQVQESLSENSPSELTLRSLVEYQTAIDAMRYLWALLDLSTTDNMSLHIGSHLIDCEEHYCQLQLASGKNLDAKQKLPISPTFYPQYAALKTFSLLTDEPEIKNRISLARINHKILDEAFNFKNEHFNIELQATGELLGNHNHIILLLENLIKNALFFSSKNRFQQKSDRIVVRLIAMDGNAHFSIYNRGPHVNQDEIPQIFKIGYSTRRNNQHHGKGIGLFFANEIVKGYQGNIEVENINNSNILYQLQINLKNKEPLLFDIETSFLDGKMKARIKGEKLWLTELAITQITPVVSLEITTLEVSASDDEMLQHNDKLEVTDLTNSSDWLEPSPQLQPRWMIQFKTSKKEHKIIFKPLDINGVQFDIKLPTADYQLNEQQNDALDEISNDES